MIQLPVNPLFAAITWGNPFPYDFSSLSHRSGRIVAHALQREFCFFLGICLCAALASAFQAGWGLDFDWAITTPWLFSFQPFCWRFTGVLGSLSCCMTQFWPCYSCHTDVLTFDSGTLWYTEGFMVDSVTVRYPGPVATKKSPNSSALHQHAWILVWDVCAEKFFGFHQMWRCALLSNISTLDIVLEVLFFFRCNFPK